MNTQVTTSKSLLITVIASAAAVITASIIATVLFLNAHARTKVENSATRSSAVQECFEIAKGVRITNGKTKDEEWKLEQVDINYEIVSKCLQEKNRS